MPRNVRNFWIEGSRDDGVPVKGFGPVGADKGFSLTILMREEGGISEKTLRIRGYALPDGRLCLEANAGGQAITLRTMR